MSSATANARIQKNAGAYVESETMIAAALEIAGVPMSFSTGDILGFPGQQVQLFADMSSPYDVENQNFSWQVVQDDLDSLNIVVGSIFQYSARNVTYSFEVLSIEPDMTGWSKLRAEMGDRV